jgi:hypothetical protein
MRKYVKPKCLTLQCTSPKQTTKKIEEEPNPFATKLQMRGQFSLRKNQFHASDKYFSSAKNWCDRNENLESSASLTHQIAQAWALAKEAQSAGDFVSYLVAADHFHRLQECLAYL